MGAEMGFTMKRKIKWKVVVAAGAAVIAVGVIANVVFRYFRYDAYKQYLSSYEVESGSEFQAAKDDKPSVPGMVLVAENDTLNQYRNDRDRSLRKRIRKYHLFQSGGARFRCDCRWCECGRTECDTDTYLLQCGEKQCDDEQL
jgi:hypothetical protein